jgi:hypothetical protein
MSMENVWELWGMSENEFWEPTTLSGQVVWELWRTHDFVGVKIKQKVEIKKIFYIFNPVRYFV